jgi:hypothetical protein
LSFIGNLDIVIQNVVPAPRLQAYPLGADPVTGKAIMQTQRMTLKWEGTFIELCMSRINADQKATIDARCNRFESDVRSLWYNNTALLKSLFDADNWWSVDSLDHAMGLVFTDRRVLEKKMSAIAFQIDGKPVTVEPEALQRSIYAPESLEPLRQDDRLICHGTLREAVLSLQVDFEAPFDPTLITLSFLRYPSYGYLLIDLDYDGHDDIEFTWGATTYLKPRFWGKELYDDTSG